MAKFYHAERSARRNVAGSIRRGVPGIEMSGRMAVEKKANLLLDFRLSVSQYYQSGPRKSRTTRASRMIPSCH